MADARRQQSIEVENIGWSKINLRENLGEILATAGGKIVDAANFFAAMK